MTAGASWCRAAARRTDTSGSVSSGKGACCRSSRELPSLGSADIGTPIDAALRIRHDGIEHRREVAGQPPWWLRQQVGRIDY